MFTLIIAISKSARDSWGAREHHTHEIFLYYSETETWEVGKKNTSGLREFEIKATG